MTAIQPQCSSLARCEYSQLELFSPAQLGPRAGLWARCRRRWLTPEREARLWRLALTCWPRFRLGGLPVRFHISCYLYPLGFVFWLNRADGWPENIIETVVLILLIWGSLLAHEWAHVLAARSVGTKAEGITFTSLGAAASLESMPRGLPEFWIALAGPLCSLVLSADFYMLHRLTRHPGYAAHLGFSQAMELGCIGNLLIAALNLLPCYPLDGGRLLRSGLAVGLARLFPQYRDKSHLWSTWFAARCVVPLIVVLGFIVTILWVHAWLYLVLLPLLWLVAEAEYRELAESAAASPGTADTLELSTPNPAPAAPLPSAWRPGITNPNAL